MENRSWNTYENTVKERPAGTLFWIIWLRATLWRDNTEYDNGVVQYEDNDREGKAGFN